MNGLTRKPAFNPAGMPLVSNIREFIQSMSIPNQPFQFCVIGCGAHSSLVHGPSLALCAKEIAGLQLSAACDLNPIAAANFAEKFGFAQSYSDVDKMLEEVRPDAVLVVLPHHLTAKICRPLLVRGIPLLMEKPPAQTAAELDRLIAAQEEGGANVQVGFNRRYTKLLQETRALLQNELPSPGILRIDYEMVRSNRRDSNFSITAIHAIDAIRFLVDSPFAKASFDYHELPKEGDGVANITMNATCESGARIGLSIQPMAGVLHERAAIHGTGRSLVIDLPMWGTQPLGRLRYWKNAKLVQDLRESNDPSVPVPLHIRSGFLDEYRAFFQNLKEGSPTTPSLQDCRQQVVLMEAIENRIPSVNFTD
ncbi:MAG: Gfo/Idh/MocA family protein [Puniceicoccales bacterium]